jgi:S1-C subfamily serine protease
VPSLALLLGGIASAQSALPPPPDSLEAEPAPTPTPPPRPAAPRFATCPRYGYRCEPSWHYCIACGWDMTVLEGEAEENKLQAIARSTVGVIVGGRRNRFSTAFPYGGSGLLLTNARFLIGADESRTRVRTFNNREYPAKIVGYDLPSGVGVLQAEIPGITPPQIAPGSPAPPESSWAVCYPVMIEDDVVHYVPVALHRGRLTASGQSGTFLVSFENLLRTDHSIEDGCSGGPLVDSRGRIAGMILGGPDDGLTYALPMEGLSSIIASLTKNKQPERPYFGVGLVLPDERRRAKFGIEAGKIQPMVAYLIPGSPASQAGLRPGELLLAVGGEPIASVWEAGKRLLAAETGGAPVELTLSSGGAERRVSVKPVRRPERVLLDPIDELQETLEANLKETGSGGGAPPGLLITDVVRGGRGEEAYFKNGDVITAVEKKTVKTFQAFDEAIRAQFKEIFTADGSGVDRRFASSYVVNLEVRKEGQEKVTREYVNLFPDFLAPPVY